MQLNFGRDERNHSSYRTRVPSEVLEVGNLGCVVALLLFGNFLSGVVLVVADRHESVFGESLGLLNTGTGQVDLFTGID